MSHSVLLGMKNGKTCRLIMVEWVLENGKTGPCCVIFIVEREWRTERAFRVCVCVCVIFIVGLDRVVFKVFLRKVFKLGYHHASIFLFKE